LDPFIFDSDLMKSMINAVTTIQPTNLEIPLWRLMTLVGVVVDKDDMSALIVAIKNLCLKVY